MIDLSRFTPAQVAALKAWWAQKNQRPQPTQPAQKG